MLLSVFSCYNCRFCLMPEKSRFLSVKDSIASFLNYGLKTRLQDSEDSLRIFEHDMEIAGKIQRNILPESVPAIAGYDIGAVFKPAKDVGGDFYDFIPILSQLLTQWVSWLPMSRTRVCPPQCTRCLPTACSIPRSVPTAEPLPLKR